MSGTGIDGAALAGYRLRMGERIAVTIGLALALAACGRAHPPSDDPDAAVIPDAPPPVDANRCGPDGTVPYGTSRGRAFRPVSLDDCSGVSTPFYGPDYCNYRFTVVTISVDWCIPSRNELDAIASWRAIYEARGVRFVDVTMQNEVRTAPTQGSCASWQQAHMTENEWMDPAQVMQIYFPGQIYPAAMIVDREGIIVYHEEGEAETPETLRAALDALTR